MRTRDAASEADESIAFLDHDVIIEDDDRRGARGAPTAASSAFSSTVPLTTRIIADPAADGSDVVFGLDDERRFFFELDESLRRIVAFYGAPPGASPRGIRQGEEPALALTLRDATGRGGGARGSDRRTRARRGGADGVASHLLREFRRCGGRAIDQTRRRRFSERRRRGDCPSARIFSRTPSGGR